MSDSFKLPRRATRTPPDLPDPTQSSTSSTPLTPLTPPAPPISPTPVQPTEVEVTEVTHLLDPAPPAAPPVHDTPKPGYGHGHYSQDPGELDADGSLVDLDALQQYSDAAQDDDIGDEDDDDDEDDEDAPEENFHSVLDNGGPDTNTDIAADADPDNPFGPDPLSPTGDAVTAGILTRDGYLLRDRPDNRFKKWSQVPIGPTPAADLIPSLSDRDLSILLAVAQHGVLTSEQIALAFFRSHHTARRALDTLCNHRLLARLTLRWLDWPYILGYNMPDNVPIVLDWNGYYLLKRLHPHAVRTWNPSTLTGRHASLSHNIQAQQAWAYMIAAARASHARALPALPLSPPSDSAKLPASPPPNLSAPLLSIAYANEDQAAVASSVSSHSSSTAYSASPPNPANSTRGSNQGRRLLTRPDALFVLLVNTPAGLQQVPTAYESYLRAALTARDGRRIDRSWELAHVQDLPTPYALHSLQQQAGGDAIFKHILLELETGTHTSYSLKEKIQTYNKLMPRKDLWQRVYGERFPRILIVVPSSRVLNFQASIWHDTYANKNPTAALITSLDLLRSAYQHKDAGQTGRDGQAGQAGPGSQGGQDAQAGQGLLTQPCFLDIAAWPSTNLLTFGQAFMINGLP